MLLLLVLALNFSRKDKEQTGGWDDPYAWIRPWVIVDFFRNFWLTR
jgi:hypothetical protein